MGTALVSDARNLVFSAHTVIGSERKWPSASCDKFSGLSGFLTVCIRHLNDLTNQVQVYEALLKELCSKLDSHDAEYVEQVIEKVSKPFV